jgi:hypothetical protein
LGRSTNSWRLLLLLLEIRRVRHILVLLETIGLHHFFLQLETLGLRLLLLLLETHPAYFCFYWFLERLGSLLVVQEMLRVLHLLLLRA